MAMPSWFCSSAGTLSLTAMSQRLTKIDATDSTFGSSPFGDAPLDAAQVRLGDGDVLLAREEQRDVDRHAGEDRFLDRRDAGRRARDLDEDVRPRRLRRAAAPRPRSSCAVSSTSSGETSSETQPSTPPVRVVDRPEQVGGARQVVDREREEELLAGAAAARELGDLLVVGVAGADRLLEDGRVRGQAGDRVARRCSARACRRRACRG